MVIHGPPTLVTQFFRHSGHPVRHHRGLHGDRFRELISIATIILLALVYPAGLLLFIFTP